MKKIFRSVWHLIKRTACGCFRILFRIMGRNLTDQTMDTFVQFLKFGIVGVSNTCISYVIYVCCLLFFHNRHLFPDTDYLAAQGISFFITVLWAFYWNDKVVFGTGGHADCSRWKMLLKTYVSYSFTGLFLNSVLLIVWVRAGVPEMAAPAVNLLVTVPLNFIISKWWTFNDHSRG